MLTLPTRCECLICNQRFSPGWLLGSIAPCMVRVPCIRYLQDGWTPINAAVNGGHSAVVRLLLEAHADVNISNKVWERVGIKD
jgi:ankyrin repeat protein